MDDEEEFKELRVWTDERKEKLLQGNIYGSSWDAEFVAVLVAPPGCVLCTVAALQLIQLSHVYIHVSHIM